MRNTWRYRHDAAERFVNWEPVDHVTGLVRCAAQTLAVDGRCFMKSLGSGQLTHQPVCALVSEWGSLEVTASTLGVQTVSINECFTARPVLSVEHILFQGGSMSRWGATRARDPALQVPLYGGLVVVPCNGCRCRTPKWSGRPLKLLCICAAIWHVDPGMIAFVHRWPANFSGSGGGKHLRFGRMCASSCVLRRAQ